MAGFLQSNSEGTQELARIVRESLDGYLGFSINNICSSDPVSASAIHDELQSGISRALTAWEQLISSDASAIMQAATTFGGVDGDLAQNILGVGGETT